MSHLRRVAPRFGRFGATALTLVLMAGPLPSVAAGLVGTRASNAVTTTAASTPAAIAPEVTTAVVGAVHTDNRPDAAKLSFDISGTVKSTAFVLADPDRVIVDLPQIGFAIDADAGKLGSGRNRHIKKGLIGAFRFGLLTAGRSRIVIDLAQPARIVSAAVHVVDGHPKLDIELAKTDRATFQAKAHEHGAVTVASAPPPAVAAPGKPTIVIDPGHGGPDTGAMVNGVVEKDVTLAFAKMLASKLESSGQFNVVMTRATDVFIPLSDRVGVARHSAASLMISIHADTLPETADVSGATVYTVSDKASDAYAAKVAAKENEADSEVGVDGLPDKADVNDILFDLTRQETRAYSHVFARTLVNYWKVAGRLNKNPQRAAGFVVLKAPDVPSVLLELGYLSNQADVATLSSDDWRDKATGQMAEAIKAYFADQRGTAKAAAGVPIPLPTAMNVSLRQTSASPLDGK